MIYKTLSRLQERHSIIKASYTKNIPILHRGFSACILRVMLFVFWCFIWLESGTRYLSLDYVYYDTGDTRLIIIPILISLAGILIFKPQKIITDRTCFGKIEKIEKQNAEVIKKNDKGVRVIVKKMHSALYDGTNTLTIRKSNGRLLQRKVPNLANFDMIYDLDSSVSLICGVRFPVPMNKNVIPDGKCFCTKCGSFESAERHRCSMCFSILWYK